MEYLGKLLTQQAYLRISAAVHVPRGLGGVKVGPQRPLGVFLERIGLMDASWSGLGDILERSWTALRQKKTNLERQEFQEVSAILGAKRLPKVRPRRCKIEVRKLFKLKMLILQKPYFSFVCL